jgi:hypothetical protein
MKICQVWTLPRVNGSGKLQNNIQNLTTERETLQESLVVVMVVILLFLISELVNFGYT